MPSDSRIFVKDAKAASEEDEDDEWIDLAADGHEPLNYVAAPDPTKQDSPFSRSPAAFQKRRDPAGTVSRQQSLQKKRKQYTE